MNASRIVCRFSCGAASAVATKLVCVEQAAKGRLDELIIVNAFIKEEHEDNRRFLADCERWFEHPVTVIHNEKYKASTLEVWRRKRYIKGLLGAPCSQELKRELLDKFSRPTDIFVLGFTAEERDRLDTFIDANNGRRVIVPLIERGLTKADCLAIIARADIEVPAMYKLGYRNANCIGCPKGGQNYWQAIRADFPERFVQIREIQESIGPGAYFLRFRSGPRKNQRMSLAELPPGRGNMNEDPDFSCGALCELAEEEIGEDAP